MLQGLEIIQELGQQRQRKFGKVYLCRQLDNNQKIIVKQVRKEPKNSRAITQLFHEKEFSFTLNRLPQIIDLKEDDNYFYLLSTYIEGKTLKEFWLTIKRHNRIVFLQQFIEEIAPIFNFLKEKKIVHNDIKPSNFIINEVNGKLHVSLIDFGLAIKIEHHSYRTTLFPLGFASPELVLNQLSILDQRSDIFALGITLWNLYTDRLPLLHPNPSIYTNLQLSHPLPNASDIQQDLFEIIEKCCVKHPFKTAPNLMSKDQVHANLLDAMNKRYQSIEALQLDINKLKDRKTMKRFLIQVFSKTNIKREKE